MLNRQILATEPEPVVPPSFPLDPPIKEPEPDRLPDEEPLPNPDENRKPPILQ